MTGNIDESTTRGSSDETFTIYSAMSDAFATQVPSRYQNGFTPGLFVFVVVTSMEKRGPPKPVLETRGSTRFRVQCCQNAVVRD